MSVFKLPTDEQINPDILQRLKTLPAINLYRLLASLPTLFHPWIDLVNGLYKFSFDMRLREMGIVRQAYRARCVYELHQHKLIALANGVSEKEIEAITHENPVSSLSEIENLVCKVADEIETEATLSSETREQLIQAVGTEKALELIAVLSFYSCVARFLNATQIPLEKESPLAGKKNPAP